MVARHPFRVVVGVDGTASSLAALDQAMRLRAPDGRLVAVVVSEEHLSVHAGFGALHAAEDLAHEFEAACDAARSALAGVAGAEVRQASGRAGAALRAIATEVGADLIALGAHDHGRIAAMLFGSVVEDTLHAWPRSTLVARAGGDALTAVVAGFDGTPAGREALQIADALAARLAIPLHPVTAGGTVRADGAVDVPGLSVDTRAPVEALASRCAPSDLLVVGSRGLTGPSSIRSVSERAVRRAPCSVLVVHEGAGAAGPETTAVGRAANP